MQVDFYILEESTVDAWLRFVCSLTDKAYQQKKTVYIHCQDRDLAVQLDDLLWTFEDNQFIPHNLIEEHLTPPPPIQLGFDEPVEKRADYLINLNQKIPSNHHRFKQIIEVVYQNESMKQHLRQHYKYYKQQGFDVKAHNVSTVDA